MKKAIIFVFGAMLLVATACGGESKKGKWSDSDKEKFDKEMEKIGSSLDAMGDQKEAFIKCYYEKLEANYADFDEANSDGPGAKKYAQECAMEVMGMGGEDSGDEGGEE